MSTAGTPASAKFGTEPKRFRNDVEQVKDDFNRLKEDVAGTGRDLAAATRTGIDQTKARAREAIDTARERISSAALSARDTGARQVEDLQDRIAERPLTALGIAFGVGLLAGVMFGRRG